MIAASSMDCESRSRWGRRFLRFILLSVLITTGIVLMMGESSSGWRHVALNFFYGFTYSACIGGLGWLIMPRIGEYAEGSKPAVRWTLAVLGMAAIATVGYLLALTVLATLGVYPWTRYWFIFWNNLRFVLVISMAIGVTITLYESMKYQLQYEAARARLSSLESRLHPHFLFNTLNSISALIPENPAAAERMTERLAALLRFSLDSSERPTVTLEQEVKIATDYLEIEKTRFGARLNYSVDIPPELMRTEVPPFSLQTLIENSVKYGGGEIRVTASNGNGRLILNVWDSGACFPKDGTLPAGHGLDNLRSRLAVLWGPRATLEFHREDSGTSVRISLPIEQAG